MAVRAGAAAAGAAVVAVLSAALALYGPPLDAGTRPRGRAGGAAGRRATPRARPRLPKRREAEQASRTSAPSVFGASGPHEALETLFTPSLGRGPPLSRRRGDPAVKRGSEPGSPQAAAGAGRPGAELRGCRAPSSLRCRAPPARPPRPPAPPPPRFVWRYLVGRCLSKIRALCCGLAKIFLSRLEVSSLGQLAELFTREKKKTNNCRSPTSPPGLLASPG